MLYILLLATSLPLTPAFPPEPVGKPVTVQILDGYFVKNTTPIPPTGMAALILKDQETFDNTFEKVPPMGVRRPGTSATLQKSSWPLQPKLTPPLNTPRSMFPAPTTYSASNSNPPSPTPTT